MKLLDLWSAGWKHRGRTRAVGPGAYERYATLGLFGHGGVVGVSNATGLREACLAVNRFLRTRFPDGTWSSIAVLFTPRMGLQPRHPEHARAARQLRCSPLPQGRTPRGQHVGSCCLCPTSLCSGDGAAPASAERSGLPVACVKLIAGKREHFLGRWGKVGIPTSHPEACRGPHLYRKGRPEVAFHPSRRFCPTFRPESCRGASLVFEGAPGSRL